MMKISLDMIRSKKLCVTYCYDTIIHTCLFINWRYVAISTGKNFHTSITRMLFLDWCQSHQNWTHISLLFNYGVRMSNRILVVLQKQLHPCLQVAAINPLCLCTGIVYVAVHVTSEIDNNVKCPPPPTHTHSRSPVWHFIAPTTLFAHFTALCLRNRDTISIQFCSSHRGGWF